MREGSDPIISAPTIAIPRFNLPTVRLSRVKMTPIRHVRLILSGVSARHERIGQTPKAILFNGFGVFYRVSRKLIITNY